MTTTKETIDHDVTLSKSCSQSLSRFTIHTAASRSFALVAGRAFIELRMVVSRAGRLACCMHGRVSLV